MKRFIVIIEDPGRVCTNHAVVDTARNVRVCQCSEPEDAELIATALNLQFRAMFDKLIGKTKECAQ